LSETLLRGFSGTVGMPALAIAAEISKYSYRLLLRTARRSPVRMPRARTACASWLERVSSSANVHSRSPSTTATRRGVAWPNSRIPAAMWSWTPFIALFPS
jgi:hypothetical protein